MSFRWLLRRFLPLIGQKVRALIAQNFRMLSQSGRYRHADRRPRSGIQNSANAPLIRCKFIWRYLQTNRYKSGSFQLACLSFLSLRQNLRELPVGLQLFCPSFATRGFCQLAHAFLNRLAARRCE